MELENITFDFSQHLQDCLLIMAIFDKEITHNMMCYVNPNNFISELSKIVCTVILDYYKEYKDAPGEHFGDIMLDKLQSLPEEKAKMVVEYIHKLYELLPNKEYVLNNLSRFVRYTNIIKGIIDGSKLVEAGKYQEADKVIKEAFKVGIPSQEDGIDYILEPDKRAEEQEIICKTQIDALDKFLYGFSRKELVIWLGSTNSGKCLKVGTKVIMADGSMQTVETIKVGDKVMGPDSKSRTVLTTTTGTGKLYKVKQSQAEDYIVNEDHILSLKKAKWKSPSFQNKEDVKNVPIKDFIKILDNVSSANNGFPKRCFRGYKAGMVNFPEKSISISPYFLGLWLGDGGKGNVTIANMEPEIEQFCKEYAEKLGGTFTATPYSAEKKCKRLSIVSYKGVSGGGKYGRKVEYPLADQFIKYNLRRNKHIPNDFLINSEENRLQLLAGIIDTDGHFFTNAYSITQKSEELAKQIKFLADSLGFKTSIKRKTKTCKMGDYNFTGEYSNVTIMGDIWRIPCKVERKKAKIVKKKDFLSSKIKIEDAGIGEYAGFSLDGDHLFLLEDGTVTHNSWALIHCAKAAMLQRCKVLYYTLEMSPEWTATRIDMGIMGMGTRATTIILPHMEGEAYKVENIFEHGVELRKKLDYIKSLGGRLLIKGNPTGGLTLSKLRNDLDILETTKDFVPDLIIIDYADLMHSETNYSELRHNLAGIYVGLRELAVERNCTVISASQTNRAGIGAKVVSLKHFAEDIQKAMISDVVLSVCQTEQEKEINKFRIFCCKNRSYVVGFQIENWYSYIIGQFSLFSRLYEVEEETLDKTASDSVQYKDKKVQSNGKKPYLLKRSQRG